MLSKEIPYERGIQDVSFQDPGVFFWPISLPLSQELVTPSSITHLEEPAYRVGQTAINEAGRRRVLGGRMEVIRDVRLQAGKVEYRMDPPWGRWEVQTDGRWCNDPRDGERTDEARGQFGTGGA